MAVDEKELRTFEGISQRLVFPVCLPMTDGSTFQMYGITRRELYAMAALQGILAGGRETQPKSTARSAVQHSDALLAELAQ